MLRPCHDCIDQKFDPFEGNGTTCCYLVEFYPNANEVSSPDYQNQKEINPDDLFLFIQIILDVVNHILKWLEVKYITILILLKSSLYKLVNVWNKLVVCVKLKRMDSHFYWNMLLPLPVKIDPTHELDQRKQNYFQ